MDNETKNKIDNLERQVNELVSWKNEKTRQQISFPIDIESIEVLNKYFLRTFIELTTKFGTTYNTQYFSKQDNKYFISNYKAFDIAEFTVDVPNNKIIVSKMLFNNEALPVEESKVFLIETTDTAPSPLDLLTTPYYMVKNIVGNKMQLADSSTGTIITLTDIGVGKHYLVYIN